MPTFNYTALDAKGKETKGTLDVSTQSEALSRLKEMGYFPTKVTESDKKKDDKEKDKDKKADAKAKPAAKKGAKKGLDLNFNIKIPGLYGKVKPKVLCTFTRQLATLIDAGLPLLRGLLVLQKQEKDATLKDILGQLATSIEGGSTFSEALALHPKTFNRLFVNMVKAGELGGVLEVVLNRLAEFQEKAQKIKGKVIAAMFYPVAVLTVAVAIVGVLMVFVVPKFEEIFKDLLNGQPMPGFTTLVLNIAHMIKDNILGTLGIIAGVVITFKLFVRTKIGRRIFDKFKLIMPVMGPVISKVAISRFTRTLGTLVSSGVPILQALSIVRETSGNVIVANAVQAVHESVKEGETITAPLEASRVFPPMVISMVDVGEQTGALPEMLMKVADNYDEEVDNAVSAMTSLLEPIMIVFLAVIVGSIVIAMFLPLIAIMDSIGDDSGSGPAQKQGAKDG
jgi:type IV pilus assembly protein PilC